MIKKTTKLKSYVALFISLSLSFTFIATMVVFYFGYYKSTVDFRIELLYENAVKINTAIQDSQGALIDLSKLLATTLESDIDENTQTQLINEYIENSEMVVGVYQIDKSGKIFSAYPNEKNVVGLNHLSHYFQDRQDPNQYYFSDKTYDRLLEKDVIYFIYPVDGFDLVVAHEFNVESILTYYQVDQGTYIAKLVDQFNNVVFSSDGDFVNFKPNTESSILTTINSQSIEVDSYTGRDGIKYFIYDQAIPNSSWVLRVNVPHSDIYGSLVSNALFPVFFLIAVIVSIIIAYRQLRIYVVEPLEKLDGNLISVFKNETDSIEPIDSSVDIIESLNKSFILMQKGIEDRESNLQEFTYVASHDLQEPLRMITSYLRIIEMEYNDLLDDEGKKYMNYVTDAAIRMKALIEDLLRYSRSGRIETDEEVDLNEILTEVIEALEYDINKTKTQLDIGKLPVVQGNHLSLKQVFQNLITNSMKFCDKTPNIQVWFENNKLYLKDNGIGMDENFIHKIFIAFQRLHSREEYPGTGIGLAIVKKVVEKHGWQIIVDSTVGEGSTFIIDME